MAAFGLVILLFLFWFLVGLAVVSRLHTRRNVLQYCLLAPAAGLAATTLLVIWLNYAGVPIRYGGPVATALLAVASAGLLVRGHPILPVRRLLPFALVLVIALVATGYPLLRFGFDWVSYMNDDMANYCLGAKLFLNHGHFSVPPTQDVVSDRDVSLLYWYSLVVPATRHGTEQMLAWLSSITWLSPARVFMPLILAFNLVLITSTGAFVLRNRRYRGAAWFTSFALALSALTTLGALYQLLGQVAGLSLLAAGCALVLYPAHRRRSEMFLTAMIVATLSMLYPEVLPFLLLSYLAHHLILIHQEREGLDEILANLWVTGLLTVFLLNISLIITGVTIAVQMSSAIRDAALTRPLFPYYLIPAAFAYLWGFHSIDQPALGRALDIAIVVGALLLGAVLVYAAFRLRKAEPVAIVFLIMFGIALQLFWIQSGFGLFKLAMYIQPFLLGTLSVSWIHMAGRSFRLRIYQCVWLSAFLILVGYGIKTQSRYASGSLGDEIRSFVEVPHASSAGFLSDLERDGRRSGPVISDTSNIVEAKLQSLYSGPIYFVAKDFFHNHMNSDKVQYNTEFGKWNPFMLLYGDSALEAMEQRQSRFETKLFDMHGALPSANSFVTRSEFLGSKDLPLLSSAVKTSIVNMRSQSRSTSSQTASSEATSQNYLMFVASQYGNSYYLVEGPEFEDRPAGRVSMYQMESDYFFPRGNMIALGRVSLFRILRPTKTIRLVLEYTASFNADRLSEIPRASVIGNERKLFSIDGRGSARLFSAPLEPQNIDGVQYIALDMGTWGWSFQSVRSPIMRLWGEDIPLDNRKIVGFARDISAISDEEYAALTPPRAIQLFPNDLGNNNLEYSGMYEDGWTAESSYVVLQQPPEPSSLIVSLAVPTLSGRLASSAVTLLIDGQEVGRQSTEGGGVMFKVPGYKGALRRRIQLKFDRSERLTAPDSRAVSAQIRYIGFQHEDAQAYETTVSTR